MPSSVRARHMICLLEGVERLEPALRARVLRAIPVELQDEVRAATPVAWMPLEWNVQLAEIIAKQLGPARAQPFFRAILLAEYESSLFRSFVRGVTSALGMSPKLFVKMAPHAWELVYRECGTLLSLHVEDGEAHLGFRDLPPVCVRNALWLDAVRSTFYTAFDLSNIDGQIDWHELDLENRRATMRFSWQDS